MADRPPAANGRSMTTSETTTRRVTLRLCSSCRPERAGADMAALYAALAASALASDVSLVAQSCFNACGRPVVMSLQAANAATCLFGGVDPVQDASDILATLRAYLDADAGWIEDAQRCGRLRLCLLGRVPAMP